MTPKTLCGFFIRALVVFSLFAFCWPIVGSAYGAAFRASGNVLANVWSQRIVTISLSQERPSNRDTELGVIDKLMHKKSTTVLSSRRHGYMPTALVIALSLATPIAWPRRCRVALAAFFCVNIYIAFKLWLLPLAYEPVQVQTAAQSSGEQTSIVSTFFWIVSASSAGWAIVPVLIWLLLIFREREWGRLTGNDTRLPSTSHPRGEE